MYILHKTKGNVFVNISKSLVFNAVAGQFGHGRFGSGWVRLVWVRIGKVR